MTFGAVFASILAVLAASDGTARALLYEAPAPLPASPGIASPEPAPDAAALAPAGEAPPAPPGALAEAARVVLTAAEAGAPILVAPAPPAPAEDAPAEVGAAPLAEVAAEPELAPAPAGPPLSDAAPILLDRLEAEDGWATERLIEPSGEIVVHTVNAAGTVQVCNPVGSLLSLALVEQRPATGGEFVHVARDASGALVSYAIGTDGEPRAVRLLAPAPR